MARVNNWNRVVFSHYSEFPMEHWRWPNFTPQEVACRDGSLMIDAHSMDCLQKLRNQLGEPIILNSAYRSPEYNRSVGGVSQSQHLEAKAYDCRMKNHDPQQFEAVARECGFTSFGYYVSQGFMHIDTRDSPAKWGDPFPRMREDSPAY
ncbi:MAG: D-Ala-D-Ala carboxypeptidase family metallohydrolase [Pelagimonas sp.]|uniref:D-Ala-D-Ala carboxypeptidase family metallohydrolase n=1 Tax=Pelagimonas sp. TaxID=2073170 RepID=UPI003D6BBA98